jgi:hypothetical protein
MHRWTTMMTMTMTRMTWRRSWNKPLLSLTPRPIDFHLYHSYCILQSYFTFTRYGYIFPCYPSPAFGCQISL